MESWYKVTLSSDGILSGKHMKLQNDFAQLFMLSRGPSDAAMFTDMMNLGETDNFYFSPGAVRIAGNLIASYAGVKCDRPNRSGTALLVGNADAFSLLNS